MEMEPLTTVDYEDIASVFSYEMFDRQMNTFIAMWNLLLLFMRTVYLMMHFSRAENLCGVSLSDEEAGLIFESSIQKYIDSPKGKEDIDIYFAALLACRQWACRCFTDSNHKFTYLFLLMKAYAI